MSVRINKFISDSGICSRREADRYIEDGHVFVNGKRAEIGTTVTRKDKVFLNGLLIEPKKEEDFVVIALNKPRGIVSTTERSEPDNIVGYVGYHERIFPIGRLDKDSQGLIFMTNNGDIVNKILRAGNAHEKEYIVTVNRPVTDDFIEKMSAGIPILGRMTKKCKVEKISEFVFSIILVQGLNRQIRRMCEYLNYSVTKLERVRIMNITLKGLSLGDWRYLTPNEMDILNDAINYSSSDMYVEDSKSNHRRSNNSIRLDLNTKGTSNYLSDDKVGYSSGQMVKGELKEILRTKGKKSTHSESVARDRSKSGASKSSAKFTTFNPKARELRKGKKGKPKFDSKSTPSSKYSNPRSKKR